MAITPLPVLKAATGRKRSFVTVAIFFIAIPSLIGQGTQPATGPAATAPLLFAPTRPIEFDIATFKLNKSNGLMPYIQIPVGGDGFTAQNRPIHDLIRYAFAKGRGGSFRISGEPSWLNDDRYDVQAKVAVEDLPEWKKLNTQGQKIVLRQFLIDYLKLKIHPDPAPYPYYALVVGKGGPKFKQSKPSDTFKTSDGKSVTGRALLVTGPSELTAQAVPIEQFADMLSGHADRLVLDKTGLDDFYCFVIDFDSASDPRSPDGPPQPFFSLPPDLATPSMFSSVKRLGLQLALTKGPIDAIVIDHVERPPEN
jgi:uncharacterized protein (TIGR03435 family)